MLGFVGGNEKNWIWLLQWKIRALEALEGRIQLRDFTFKGLVWSWMSHTGSAVPFRWTGVIHLLFWVLLLAFSLHSRPHPLQQICTYPRTPTPGPTFPLCGSECLVHLPPSSRRASSWWWLWPAHLPLEPGSEERGWGAPYRGIKYLLPLEVKTLTLKSFLLGRASFEPVISGPPPLWFLLYF